MSIKTDSTPLEEPKNPDTCTVFQLYHHFATSPEKESLAERYRAGGFGYGEAKKILLAKLLEYFEPFRKKRFELEQKVSYVKDVLSEGGKKARIVAEKTMDEVKEKTGIKC